MPAHRTSIAAQEIPRIAMPRAAYASQPALACVIRSQDSIRIRAAAASRRCRAFRSPRLHVVDVARRQHEVRLLPGLIQARVVVDRHLPLAHHLEPVSRHDDRRALRETDAEQGGILLHHRNEVVPSVARVDVLIDRGPAQEVEPCSCSGSGVIITSGPTRRRARGNPPGSSRPPSSRRSRRRARAPCGIPCRSACSCTNRRCSTGGRR